LSWRVPELAGFDRSAGAGRQALQRLRQLLSERRRPWPAASP